MVAYIRKPASVHAEINMEKIIKHENPRKTRNNKNKINMVFKKNINNQRGEDPLG